MAFFISFTMRSLVILVILLCSFQSSKSFATEAFISGVNIEFSSIDVKPKPMKLLNFINNLKSKSPKLTAAALTITLGPFGAHRIYLGTSYSVPIFYTLTLGGGLGVLPITDLALILLSDDLSKYYNNSYVFMWQED